jgi:hypothetical protein
VPQKSWKQPIKKQQQPASYLAKLDDLIQARIAQRLAI